ncbi:zinc finger BED domain-containing protein 5-like [Diabrotica undecimpunctata]|uniref:zinc finger BED domain-containing protein 5-like n=1 Tax=Diabrotica undecimpunctata TaxID=50387 RepID=UPI003B640F89
MKSTKKLLSLFTGSTKKSVEASFLVSLRIAKSGKAHTIGEELLLPAAKDMVTCMLSEASAKKLELISLSNNTVQRWIDSMASNVKNKVINHVKSSDFFSIQLDESTDVTNYAQLMVYVRYIHENKTIKKDYLFCEPLSTRTTADEIFNKLDEFFTENGLDWMNCVGFCSDGARAMIGRFGGVDTKVKSVAKNCTFMHCSIYRQALAVKRMPEQFKNVLQDAIKVVNFIKSRALNSRLFSNLCCEMGSNHIQLLLHTEIRWISRGKMLNRLSQLRSEVQLFLMGTDFELRNRLTDEHWLISLAYLSDIFNRINDLNLSLQGRSTNRFSVNDKIKAFIKKFQMTEKSVSNENLASFPNLENFITENELTVSEIVINNIKNHSQMIVEIFEEYFKEDYSEFNWIRNPFVSDLDSVRENLSVNEKESLIELSCDGALQVEFNKEELCEFWLKVKNEYPSLSRKALLFLIPFTTTYLCESGFSVMLIIKNNYRNKLNIDTNLRLKLSTTEPDISSLVSNMQHHFSY